MLMTLAANHWPSHATREPVRRMKMRTPTPNSNNRFTPDSQRRLLAYTPAAGLGAFFGGQNAEAAPTLSLGLGPYPHTLIPGAGAGVYHNYFYFDVDGNGTPDFN